MHLIPKSLSPGLVKSVVQGHNGAGTSLFVSCSQCSLQLVTICRVVLQGKMNPYESPRHDKYKH